MEIFSLEGWYILLRWFHFLAGITWIGMLYYFNLVQTPFFATELGGWRALGDVSLAGQAASLLSRSVAFTILRSLTESIKLSSSSFVRPDVDVNRFVLTRRRPLVRNRPLTCSGLRSARRRSSMILQSAGVKRLLRLDRDRRPFAASCARSGR